MVYLSIWYAGFRAMWTTVNQLLQNGAPWPQRGFESLVRAWLLPLLWFLPCAAFLYLQVFTLPHTPLLLGGDQSVYLLNATRLLQGQMIYRDFFQFTLPGTELLYAALFKWFGVKTWIPQGMLILIGTSLACLSVLISKKLMSGWSVFLPGVLFLTFGFRGVLDATHHWYSTLAVISALATTIERRSPWRLAGAGALCGLATYFTQLRGLAGVAAIGLFLVWERHRKTRRRHSLVKTEACLAGPFFITVAALSAYFVWKVGLRRFVFCTVVFPLKYYPSEWFNTWRVYMTELPPLHSWLDLPRSGAFLFVVGALPLVYLLFFVRYGRVSPSFPAEPWDRLMLVNIVGLFLLLAVAPAPSYLRLCSAGLPALIILVWFLNRSGRLAQVMLRLLWTAALALAIAASARRQRHWRAYLNLPIGRVAFLDPILYDKFKWISERTHPSEPFFGDMLICLALELRNPAEVDFLTTTDYTRPEQVANVIQGLEKVRVRYVFLWDFSLDVTEEEHGPGNHLGPLSTYLRAHYHVAKAFRDGGLVWERN